jgi:hypothetical protein
LLGRGCSNNNNSRQLKESLANNLHEVSPKFPQHSDPALLTKTAPKSQASLGNRALVATESSDIEKDNTLCNSRDFDERDYPAMPSKVTPELNQTGGTITPTLTNKNNKISGLDALSPVDINNDTFLGHSSNAEGVAASEDQQATWRDDSTFAKLQPTNRAKITQAADYHTSFYCIDTERPPRIAASGSKAPPAQASKRVQKNVRSPQNSSISQLPPNQATEERGFNKQLDSLATRLVSHKQVVTSEGIGHETQLMLDQSFQLISENQPYSARSLSSEAPEPVQLDIVQPQISKMMPTSDLNSIHRSNKDNIVVDEIYINVDNIDNIDNIEIDGLNQFEDPATLKLVEILAEDCQDDSSNCVQSSKLLPGIVNAEEAFPILNKEEEFQAGTTSFYLAWADLESPSKLTLRRYSLEAGLNSLDERGSANRVRRRSNCSTKRPYIQFGDVYNINASRFAQTTERVDNDINLGNAADVGVSIIPSNLESNHQLKGEEYQQSSTEIFRRASVFDNLTLNSHLSHGNIRTFTGSNENNAASIDSSSVPNLLMPATHGHPMPVIAVSNNQQQNCGYFETSVRNPALGHVRRIQLSRLSDWTCSYCEINFDPTTEHPAVLCPFCISHSRIAYCSTSCQLADCYYHSYRCQHRTFYGAIPVLPGDPSENYAKVVRVEKNPIAPLFYHPITPECFRQQCFSMFCRAGDFPDLIGSYQRFKQIESIKPFVSTDLSKHTGDYFIFRSHSTPQGATHAPVDVICVRVPLFNYWDCFSTNIPLRRQFHFLSKIR